MPARKRRPGAHFECDFLDDPRVAMLNSVQWTLYSKLWIMSVGYRRDVLCRSRFGQKFLGLRSNLSRNSIPGALDKLHKVGLVEVTEHYIKIIGLRMLHDKMHWKPPLECCTELGASMHKNERVSKTTPVPEPEPVPEPKKKQTKKGQTNPKKQGKGNFELGFDEFWKIYPRPTSRVAAMNRWCSLVKEGTPRGDMVSAAKYYAQWAAMKPETATNFLKHPTTFLSKKDRHWAEWANGIPESELKAKAGGSRSAGAKDFDQVDYSVPEDLK